MKKYLALILAALLLTSCSSEAPEAEEAAEIAPAEETEVMEIIPTDPAVEDELPEPEVIEKPEIEQFTTLEVEGTPVYENGNLIIHFGKSVWYELDDAVSVGMILSTAAESMGGKIVSDQYPELLNEEDEYDGVAIQPAETLPTGNCLFSITFGEYLVSFELDVS